MTRSIAPPPPTPCFVVEPLAASDNDVVVLTLCMKRRAFRLYGETIPLKHFPKWNYTHLIGEI